MMSKVTPCAISSDKPCVASLMVAAWPPRARQSSFCKVAILETFAVIQQQRSKLCRPVRMSSPSVRSEEHTSELQSLMRISYAVFCLKKKKQTQHTRKIQLKTQ